MSKLDFFMGSLLVPTDTVVMRKGSREEKKHEDDGYIG